MNIFGKLFNISHTLHNPKNNIVAFANEIFSKKRNKNLDIVVDEIYKAIGNQSSEEPFNIIIPSKPIYLDRPAIVENGVSKMYINYNDIPCKIGDHIQTYMLYKFINNKTIVDKQFPVVFKVVKNISGTNIFIAEAIIPIQEWLFLAKPPITLPPGSIPEIAENVTKSILKYQLNPYTSLYPLKAFGVKFDKVIYKNTSTDQLIVNPNIIINQVILNFAVVADLKTKEHIVIKHTYSEDPYIQCISENEINLFVIPKD